MGKSRIAILSDFDGTITSINVLEQLYRRFGDASIKSFVERWESGEISTKEEIEGCFSSFKTNRLEMEAYLSTVTLDPGLAQIIQFCKESEIPFAIVSDGLSWYIDYILKCHDLHDVTVYANEIHFEPGGFRFSFPWFDLQDPLRGTSKKAIVRKFQQLEYRVIYIGDGLSDTGAADTADVLFSRDYLSEYARARDIKAIQFSSLADVLGSIKDLVVAVS